MASTNFTEVEPIERGAEPDPDLFALHGLHLPIRPKPWKAVARGARSCPTLVWSRPPATRGVSGQLDLDLRETKVVRGVIDFIPNIRRSYLDYSVYDVAKKQQGLKNAARLLSDGGVSYIGDLLICDVGFLRHTIGLAVSELTALDELLARGGLRLNMSIPYWRSPLSRTA